MAAASDSNQSEVSVFKQEVFNRLAFLGMPHGDAATVRHLWKFVNLSAKLLGAELEKNPSQSDKLVRALARELGVQRAQSFVQWLAEKIKWNFGKDVALPTPSCPGVVVVDDAKAGMVTNVAASISAASSGPVVGANVPEVLPQVSLPDSTPECSACTVSEEMEDEAWVQCKSGEGKIYFWDRRTNACAWSLPNGLRPKWRSYKSSDGRTYYADPSGKVFWVMPPLKESHSGAKAVPCPSELSVPPLFLADVGDVVAVNFPAAPEHSTSDIDDLGPFDSVFPINKVEAMRPPCPAVAAKAEALEEEAETPLVVINPTWVSKENVSSNVQASPQAARGKAKKETTKDSPTGVSHLRDELAELRAQLALLTEKTPASHCTKSPGAPVRNINSRERTKSSERSPRGCTQSADSASVSAPAQSPLDKPLPRKRPACTSKGSAPEKPRQRKFASCSSRTEASGWEEWSLARKSEECSQDESPLSPCSAKLAAAFALAQKAAAAGPDFWKASHASSRNSHVDSDAESAHIRDASSPNSPAQSDADSPDIRCTPPRKSHVDSEAESQDSVVTKLSQHEDNTAPSARSHSQDSVATELSMHDDTPAPGPRSCSSRSRSRSPFRRVALLRGRSPSLPQKRSSSKRNRSHSSEQRSRSGSQPQEQSSSKRSPPVRLVARQVSAEAPASSPGILLDKFLTSVVHGKPPGDWEAKTGKSASHSGGSSSVILRRRSSLGGA